jgi:hypothetical protein
MDGKATLTMVTSMPTTSRLMQQMARIRLGWVGFLPASTAVAASLPVGDVVGALLFGKGLQEFGCGTSETDSEYSICQVLPSHRLDGLSQVAGSIMAAGESAAASVRVRC